MKSLITAFEASQKYGFSLGHLRLLMRNGKLKGRLARINTKGTIWLIDESSLKKYLSKERRPGPKPRTKG
jgi:hypothetical protein